MRPRIFLICCPEVLKILKESRMTVGEQILKQVQEAAKMKQELVSLLVPFAATDTLLYLSDVLNEKIQKEVDDAIKSANEIMGTKFVPVLGLEVCRQNIEQQEIVRRYLEKTDDYRFAVVYLAATELRSVLAGVLLANRVLSADDVFQLTFAEELAQQERWGKDEEIKKRQQDIKQRIIELEKVCHERSLFED